MRSGWGDLQQSYIFFLKMKVLFSYWLIFWIICFHEQKKTNYGQQSEISCYNQTKDECVSVHMEHQSAETTLKGDWLHFFFCAGLIKDPFRDPDPWYPLNPELYDPLHHKLQCTWNVPQPNPTTQCLKCNESHSNQGHAAHFRSSIIRFPDVITPFYFWNWQQEIVCSIAKERSTSWYSPSVNIFSPSFLFYRISGIFKLFSCPKKLIKMMDENHFFLAVKKTRGDHDYNSASHSKTKP